MRSEYMAHTAFNMGHTSSVIKGMSWLTLFRHLQGIKNQDVVLTSIQPRNSKIQIRNLFHL